MADASMELSGGVLHASDLRERLGVSPATLMRIVRNAGPNIMRIGRGRATQYALRHLWSNLDNSRFPLAAFEQGRSSAALFLGRGAFFANDPPRKAWRFSLRCLRDESFRTGLAFAVTSATQIGIVRGATENVHTAFSAGYRRKFRHWQSHRVTAGTVRLRRRHQFQTGRRRG